LNGEDCIKGCVNAIFAGYRHIDSASIYGNSNEIRMALE
jgi:diketogulonate reductase-like aldo/keto reductase